MPEPTPAPEPSGASGFTPPYPPSWVDSLTAWVDRLPIPWWLFYVLVAVLLNAGLALGLWASEVYVRQGFHPMQVWLPTLAAYLLAFMHGMDRMARRAMLRFRPSFAGSEADLERVVYRLTTLPRRTSLLLSFILAPLLLPLGLAEFRYTQTGGLESVPGIFVAVLLVLYAVSFVWVYHVFHQLREIHRLFRDHAVVHLENVRPMYALSGVTAFTGLGIAIFNYGWVLAQPGLDPVNPVTIGESLFSLGMALLVFIWPLWGAHRKLSEAKDAARAELAVRKQVTRRRVYQAVAGDDLASIGPLNQVLGVLQAEDLDLEAVPTWPWSPGMLRNLIGAVMLPVVLWLIQYGLQRLMG
jgi:hypothetical protein